MSEATETAGAAAEDRVAVASNWQLVWWRFRRHWLAMASAGLLAFMYMIVLVPDFFATQTPNAPTRGRRSFRCRWCICSTTDRSRPGCRRPSASAIR